MSSFVAVTGKGGTGKTTVAAALVRLLMERRVRPVLAVDADPNHNLGPFLGVQVEGTLGDIREEVMKGKAGAGGAPKGRLLEQKVAEVLVEAEGFDLLTMGRSEGPSCYCYVNNLLRGALSSVAANYRAVVVDNEAGMEHISRMNLREVGCLVLVAEPTAVSGRSVVRIVELAESLAVKVRRRVLVWNKVRPGGVPPEALRAAAGARFDAALELPFDERIERLAAVEASILPIELPAEFGRLAEECLTGFPNDAAGRGGRL